MTKILIIRFSSIGDIVLTTPLVRCLKKQLTDAEIHFLTKPQYKNLLANNPYLSKIHLLDKPAFQKAKELSELNFDFVIDLHKNIRSLIFKTILNTVAYSFDKLNLKKWLLVNFKINELPNTHIVDRYMQTVAPFGVSNDGEGLDYFIPEHVSVSNLPEKFIAFAIGGQHHTKKLPNEKIISICKSLDLPVILLGGKEDESNAEMIVQHSSSHVMNMCGKLSLDESAFVIRQATKVITHDTGLMHIAAAFKKEIISIWGNTIPEFGMYPYYGKCTVPNAQCQVQKLDCRPCTKIGFDKCPKGHFNCMNMQNLEEIVSAVNS